MAAEGWQVASAHGRPRIRRGKWSKKSQNAEEMWIRDETRRQSGALTSSIRRRYSPPVLAYSELSSIRIWLTDKYHYNLSSLPINHYNSPIFRYNIYSYNLFFSFDVPFYIYLIFLVHSQVSYFRTIQTTSVVSLLFTWWHMGLKPSSSTFLYSDLFVSAFLDLFFLF